jgi:protein-disulfide isomerase
VHAADHVRATAGADLELVMYGDFECPYCAAAQGILARVERRLEGRLRLVFRHFPVETVHPNAWAAAEASEAAAGQGAFWEMHDALYAARGRLAADDLVRHAGALGLDAARIAEELGAGTHRPRVEHDLHTGRAAAVTGTPAFFANGERVEGAFDAGSLVAALRAH